LYEHQWRGLKHLALGRNIKKGGRVIDILLYDPEGLLCPRKCLGIGLRRGGILKPNLG